MSRRYEELLQECKEIGVDVDAFCSARGMKKPSKDQVEVILRDYYWKKNHPGEEMLVQIEPQKANNIKDLSDSDAENAWLDVDISDVIRTGYCMQLKLDGARFLMHITATGNRMTARRKSDKDYVYSEKTDQMSYHRDFPLKELAGTILDGEIKARVAQIDTGKNKTVTELQATIAMTNSAPEKSKSFQDKYGKLVFHVFDVLRWKGEDMVSQSYCYRLHLVEEFFKLIEGKDPDGIFHKVETVYKDKKETYEKWVKACEEGGMLKDLASKYEPGKRTWTWLKVKRFDDIDGIITGFHRGKEDGAWKNLVGDLSVSAYDEAGNFREFASISAFPMVMREAISVYDPKTDEVKLREDILGKVVVVRCQEWTKNVRVKHAVPLQQDVTDMSDWDKVYFRTDKDPKDCVVKFKVIEQHLQDARRI